MTEPSAARAPGDTFSGGSRKSALDGIRAIAIAIVIAFHTTADAKFPVNWLGPLGTPVLHGWLGVDLFFALSGFLITRVWIDEEAAAPAEPWRSRIRRFYARRSLRILPLYYVTFVAFLALAQVAPLNTIATFARRFASDPTSAVPYALFFANYAAFGKDGAFAARWSLCVEEHFYLLWPWVLVLVRHPRRRLLVALAVCVAVLAARSYAIAFGDHRAGWASFMMVRYASHLRLDAILWGCVIGLVYEPLARSPRVRRVGLVVAAAVLIALVASTQISVLRAPTLLGSGPGMAALAAGAGLLCAEVTAAPRSWLARALTLPPLPTLGVHSYAVYLVHPLAIELAAGAVFPREAPPTVWHWAATIALTIAVSLLAAIALDWTVDRPFRALRKRFRIPPARDGATSSPTPTREP